MGVAEAATARAPRLDIISPALVSGRHLRLRAGRGGRGDGRLARRAVFDRPGFELFLAALRSGLAVKISATTLRKARRRIEQAPRAAQRDPDDAIFRLTSHAVGHIVSRRSLKGRR